MKTLTLALAGFLGVAGIFTTAAHADEYKCYVEAGNRGGAIVFNEASSAEEARKMARSQNVLIQQKTPQPVSSVRECVLKNEAFHDSAAQKLEQSTPQ